MGNGQEEKFCLRWNDFENNISSSLRELREDKDFFDVTLACDDKQLQAHKVILSACSPFFRSVLKRNPHQHPLLYLKGVQYESILSVLNFMYHGEVNIAQEDLNSFLAVAEDLKVKGLTQNIPITETIPAAKQSEDHNLYPPSPDKRTPKQPKPITALEDKQAQEEPMPQIKTETAVLLDCEEDDQTQIGLNNQYQAETFQYEDYGQNYEEQIEESYEHEQGQIGGTIRGNF